MAAAYRRTSTGETEIAITQKTLSYVGALVALLGALFSAGISYGVMRAQLADKPDKATVEASFQAIDRRIVRDSSVMQVMRDDLHDIQRDLTDIKQRNTDIACELIRPRRTYCR